MGKKRTKALRRKATEKPVLLAGEFEVNGTRYNSTLVMVAVDPLTRTFDLKTDRENKWVMTPDFVEAMATEIRKRWDETATLEAAIAIWRTASEVQSELQKKTKIMR